MAAALGERRSIDHTKAALMLAYSGSTWSRTASGHVRGPELGEPRREILSVRVVNGL